MNRCQKIMFPRAQAETRQILHLDIFRDPRYGFLVERRHNGIHGSKAREHHVQNATITAIMLILRSIPH